MVVECRLEAKDHVDPLVVLLQCSNAVYIPYNSSLLSKTATPSSPPWTDTTPRALVVT